VDLDRALIVLPAARTKNKREHAIPLSGAAMAILSQSPRRGEFVFGLRGFVSWSKAKAKLDGRINVQPWRLHDLRRTAATVMADRLGVLPHVVEAILNHVSGHRAGVAGVYNRARYEGEMRQALDRWAAHLAPITG
jgi:integrase